MSEDPKLIPTSWAEGIRTKLELLKKEKEEKKKQEAEKQAALEKLENDISDACHSLKISLTAEEDPSAAGLRIVRRVFDGEKLRQPKIPDKIVIPNPAAPNTTMEVDVLIIPDTLFSPLPAGLDCINGQKIAGSSLVALFESATSSFQYRLYGRLREERQERGKPTRHIPLRDPIKTHQQIYEGQNSQVQRQLLFATIRAIYERAAQ